MDLPKKTEFAKRIPKQKFYDNLAISPSIKRAFVEQIKTIYWQNKISTTTLNLTKGKYVTEIEVFLIKLNNMDLDEKVLQQIDKIPYHILFLLEYEGKYQAWISYKEIVEDKINIRSYYHTRWLDREHLPCKLEGLDMDSVYENFVRQIADFDKGNEKIVKAQNNLKEEIAKDEEKKFLEKKITALQNKIRKEKQFNKKVELNNELKKLKKMLEKF